MGKVAGEKTVTRLADSACTTRAILLMVHALQVVNLELKRHVYVMKVLFIFNFISLFIVAEGKIIMDT